MNYKLHCFMRLLDLKKKLWTISFKSQLTNISEDEWLTHTEQKSLCQ